jgi:hypothetical protein
VLSIFFDTMPSAPSRQARANTVRPSSVMSSFSPALASADADPQAAAVGVSPCSTTCHPGGLHGAGVLVQRLLHQLRGKLIRRRPAPSPCAARSRSGAESGTPQRRVQRRQAEPEAAPIHYVAGRGQSAGRAVADRPYDTAAIRWRIVLTAAASARRSTTV